MPRPSLNEGITSRRLLNGPWIHMVKSRPGIYYDDKGNEVSLEKAAQAGFDVVADAKAKRRAELLEEKRKEIEARVEEEFARDVQKAEAEVERRVGREKDVKVASREAAAARGGE